MVYIYWVFIVSVYSVTLCLYVVYCMLFNHVQIKFLFCSVLLIFVFRKKQTHVSVVYLCKTVYIYYYYVITKFTLNTSRKWVPMNSYKVYTTCSWNQK